LTSTIVRTTITHKAIRLLFGSFRYLAGAFPIFVLCLNVFLFTELHLAH
jgi:hypothetical protein